MTDDFSKKRIIERSINNRPVRKFGYLSPIEVLKKIDVLHL